MKNIYLLLSFLFSILSFGQANVEYALIDKKMTEIPQNSNTSTDAIAHYINSNFKTENDKIRAVFYWTASNISYDVKNMFTVTINDNPQGRIAKTLKTKKGICGDYAAIFNEIAALVGVKSVIVEGYTKQNGKVATLSHAWCAAKIDKKWYLFDPTWGSGAVYNGKFIKKRNDYYFKTEPGKIISSHIPFDYLWQFLNYPITNQEFYEGKIQVNKSKKYFDYQEEIDKYEKLSDGDKAFETAERIQKNGILNNLILEQYKYKKNEFTILTHNLNIEKLNSITNDYNQAITLLNDFIYYRNKKFKPTFSDSEISKMIQIPKENLVKCQNDINLVGSVGSENTSSIASLKKNIYEALAQAEEYETFVKEYLSKSKTARKSMFTKVTWFGIPLN
ncbi:transglutaminase domain-containing protein [Flavobacterium soyangense]|uniref:Transglutaminase-like domain-containing protein n=1 Tax=Flavobacterium soyangense TaxID=2023265 RepID=A0A930XZG6_9FLAO|nr:transglutaminase domain-containing protein [Flavobacterium soyangense]MBF2708873.1 hypothetical protein [Flavobacterium soyangense]